MKLFSGTWRYKTVTHPLAYAGFGILTVLLLTGCKVGYKPGASGNDLNQDQRECEHQAGDDSGAVGRCMRARGWYFQDASGDPESLHDSESGPAIVVVPVSERKEEPASTVTEQAPGAPLDSKDDASSGSGGPDTLTSPDSENASEESMPVSAQPVTEALPEPSADYADPDPDAAAGAVSEAPREIGAWWKWGGTPEDLKADQQACSSAGDSAPRATMQWSGDEYFRECMRERGWRTMRQQ